MPETVNINTVVTIYRPGEIIEMGGKRFRVTKFIPPTLDQMIPQASLGGLPLSFGGVVDCEPIE